MSAPDADETVNPARTTLQQVSDLLGGARALRSTPRTTLEAHLLIEGGLPWAAFSHLVDHLSVLRGGKPIERAIGMSIRTIQRHREDPSKPLSPEQGGRTWKFAEILARATAVLGSQQEAEQWLSRPAMGLDRRCPIDLLSTPAGVELVEEFLGRLEYGVYT